MSDEPDICQKGGGGLVLPLFGDSEQDWPRGLRIFLYFIGLFYCFAGVAIIADVFMAGIEKVTSKKMRLFDKKKHRFYTFELWNPTVSNLTLMALGSSAPEILLNVIDIFAKEFFLEGLGPGTIVGSAAFNLQIIIAVCIIAIPTGQIRYIKEMTVYKVTAVASIFAYVWLVIILMLISPNVVEPWEGIITFLFFPILVLGAWAADKGYFGGGGEVKASFNADMTPQEILELEGKLRQKHGENLTHEQLLRLMEALAEKPTSRAAYRIGATRAMFGGKRVKTRPRASLTSKFSFMAAKPKIAPIAVVEDDKPIEVCRFSWSAGHYVVFENAGKVKLQVKRDGDASHRARVWYETKDGTALQGEDYKAARGWIEFLEGDLEKTIDIEIIDDKAYEDNEDFYVDLSNPQLMDDMHLSCTGKFSAHSNNSANVVGSAPAADEDTGGTAPEGNSLQVPGNSDAQVASATVTSGGPKRVAGLGQRKQAQVTIVDDDDAGILSFEKSEALYSTPATKDVTYPVTIRRSSGGCGEISVHYRFEGDSAVKGRDFEGQDGVLVLHHGQMEAGFLLTIKAVPRYDVVDVFRIILEDPHGGATLDGSKDGGPDKNIMTVSIEAECGSKDRIDKVKSLLHAKWDKSQVGHANWASQFKSALFVNGGEEEDEDDAEPPSVFDYVSHYFTVPWKLLFAFVPPVDYCGGWVTFVCALLMIGFVTMIIGDMAGLLGCVLCLPVDITAITFVALGTSLPDTFASKTAAEQDPYADASVGNVTGSNCVNVFLGLGLPWMIASLHWSIQGRSEEWNKRYQFADDLDWLGPPGMREQAFVVMAGSLGFSVAVFSGTAVVAIGILALRRKFVGGELGGPAGWKWCSAGTLTLLWLVYIGASAAQSISEAGGLSC